MHDANYIQMETEYLKAKETLKKEQTMKDY